MATAWVTLPGGRVKKFHGRRGGKGSEKGAFHDRDGWFEMEHSARRTQDEERLLHALDDHVIEEQEDQKTMVAWRAATAAHCTRTEVWAKVRPYGEVRVA